MDVRMDVRVDGGVDGRRPHPGHGSTRPTPRRRCGTPGLTWDFGAVPAFSGVMLRFEVHGEPPPLKGAARGRGPLGPPVCPQWHFAVPQGPTDPGPCTIKSIFLSTCKWTEIRTDFIFWRAFFAFFFLFKIMAQGGRRPPCSQLFFS